MKTVDNKQTNPEVEQEILDEIASRRSEKIHRFQLRFGIDNIDDIPDVEVNYEQPDAPVHTEPEEYEYSTEEKTPKKKKRR